VAVLDGSQRKTYLQGTIFQVHVAAPCTIQGAFYLFFSRLCSGQTELIADARCDAGPSSRFVVSRIGIDGLIQCRGNSLDINHKKSVRMLYEIDRVRTVQARDFSRWVSAK
jgi:hypothetical protein